MAKKNKQKQKQAQQRRERKRSDRNHRKPTPRGPSSSQLEASPRLPPIDPPEPQRCLPALHVDAAGKSVPDPYAELGVPATADDEQILAAFRARIVERPPERDPEGARRLLEARERLLDPTRAIERALGVLHVPDPAAFGLAAPPSRDLLPARERVFGQLALYALLEATLAD